MLHMSYYVHRLHRLNHSAAALCCGRLPPRVSFLRRLLPCRCHRFSLLQGGDKIIFNLGHNFLLSIKGQTAQSMAPITRRQAARKPAARRPAARKSPMRPVRQVALPTRTMRRDVVVHHREKGSGFFWLVVVLLVAAIALAVMYGNRDKISEVITTTPATTGAPGAPGAPGEEGSNNAGKIAGWTLGSIGGVALLGAILWFGVFKPREQPERAREIEKEMSRFSTVDPRIASPEQGLSDETKARVEAEKLANQDTPSYADAGGQVNTTKLGWSDIPGLGWFSGGRRRGGWRGEGR